MLKSFCCYNEVRLCGGCIYILYVGAVVLLARYVPSLSVCTRYIPGQQDNSINMQTVYTATTQTDFIIATKRF